MAKGVKGTKLRVFPEREVGIFSPPKERVMAGRPPAECRMPVGRPPSADCPSAARRVPTARRPPAECRLPVGTSASTRRASLHFRSSDIQNVLLDEVYRSRRSENRICLKCKDSSQLLFRNYAKGRLERTVCYLNDFRSVHVRQITRHVTLHLCTNAELFR